MQLSPLRFWLLNGSALFYLLSSTPTVAQIVPDATLPKNSIVPSNCTNCVITGGTTVGNNLFHSFELFSIPTGGSAYFNNDPIIKNIISRVTGKSISNIDGLIRAQGAANLFLLNPNGITFGPNASLNIGGSFLATTADRIDFADGTHFRSDGTQSSPLLTVSVPLGLQFGRSPGIISNQSVAPQVDSRGNPILDKDGHPIPVGLRVLPGRTLALVGGSVTIPGGFLTARSGRIELGSVVGPGSVSLTPTNQGWMLTYDGIQNFQDISLSQEAYVDASGAQGGDIHIQGRRVTLTQGSQVISAAQTGGQAGNLRVNASDLVELDGTSVDGKFITGLFNEVEQRATGEGRSLTIETRRLIVRGGAQVSTSTFGRGHGVDLIVKASDSVKLVGNSPDGKVPSGLFARVRRGATGDGGTLTIETGRLIVQDGAQISTDTFGAGRAGDLTVRALESVEVKGRTPDDQASGLFAKVGQGATGDGGNLTIETGQLVVLAGAQISTSARSGGQGGTLTIKASDSILLSGTAPIADSKSSSGLFVSAEQGARKNGGELNLTTGLLTVEKGAKISADTFSTAQAGNATLNVKQLMIRDGGRVGAGSFAEGSGGILTVNATESVDVTGTGTVGSDRVASALFTQANSSGKAGDLNITTTRLNVQDQADVTVSGKGTGPAGNLRITATTIRLDGGRLRAETQAGSGANINLQDLDLLLMRHQSQISAQAFNDANGGDITTNGENGFIVAVPKEDSDIIANAFRGNGGKIQITAQGIYGLEYRPQLTPLSDINASSQFGVNGTVQINTPGVDPSRGLGELPSNLVDATGLIDRRCTPADRTRERSSFTITGRGGLPPGPNDILQNESVSTNWVTADPHTNPRPRNDTSPNSDTSGGAPSTEHSAAPQTPTLIEAQGWVYGPNGEVILTAQAPHVTPHSPTLTPPTCSN
jgi:filamentous hemagglutinin family protein